jgi:TIR domain-containing protein
VSAGPTEPASVPGPKVFITYRREETAAHAGRLYDAMVARFGEGNVFMDVDMAPGVDFVERITEAVAACHVLIVVMGPRWATVEDEQGMVRIADPGDFVRIEIETALRRPDVTPIPVLVSGARMPNPEDLPPEVRAITRRNALELSDQRWRYDVRRLISTLDELLAETPLAPGSPSPESAVGPGTAAPANAAQAPGATPPPSTVAATTSLESRPAAPSAGRGRRLRWALVGATAIAAIVVAVVLAVDGGGSSTQATQFTRADLSELVLPATEAPGNLLFSTEESGPYVKGLPGIDPDLMRLLSRANAQGYRNAFSARNERAQPYEYAESTAAVFKDENAAQGALDSLKAGYQGPNIEDVPARGLGDDRLAVVENKRSPRPEFTYFWRTGNLLQIFYLIWNAPGASEDVTRDFADKMDALADL